MLPSIFEEHKIRLNRTKSLLILSAKKENFVMKRRFVI